VKKDKDFQYLQEGIVESRLERKKNLVSLNEAVRRKERDVQEARLTSHESRRGTGKSVHEDAVGKVPTPGKGSALGDDGLQADERNLANALVAEQVRKNAKDVLLDEAVSILSDEVGALKTSATLAARVKPGSLVMPD
jgi:carboxyl-terminal processing protease